MQDETPPYQYVRVEGPVIVEDSPISAPGRSDHSRDDLEMATRYLGPELARWYVDNSPSGEGAVLVRLGAGAMADQGLREALLRRH